MPILWRYLISHFLKTVILCVFAFVSILLTMRLDEIAHFAALGAPLSYIFLFTLYQIPYILPIALPISCLIASFLLVQKLSTTHELTALRACGRSLSNIFMPLLATASLLTILNFWLASELATQAHLTTNRLKSELRSINPLLLLNNKHLMRLKGIYFEALGSNRVGETANDVVFVMPNPRQQRLNLMIAHHLEASSTHFSGQDVTVVTPLEAKQENTFDDLLIENIKESNTSVEDFASFLQKKVWTINNDYLKLAFLMFRVEELYQDLQQALLNKAPHPIIKNLKIQLSRSYSEIARRLSIGIAVFSFTLMGSAFGLQIGRRRPVRALILAIFLTAFYLIAFFVAKGLDQRWITATAFYIIPHFILVASACIFLFCINQGKEV